MKIINLKDFNVEETFGKVKKISSEIRGYYQVATISRFYDYDCGSYRKHDYIIMFENKKEYSPFQKKLKWEFSYYRTEFLSIDRSFLKKEFSLEFQDWFHDKDGIVPIEVDLESHLAEPYIEAPMYAEEINLHLVAEMQLDKVGFSFKLLREPNLEYLKDIVYLWDKNQEMFTLKEYYSFIYLLSSFEIFKGVTFSLDGDEVKIYNLDDFKKVILSEKRKELGGRKKIPRSFPDDGKKYIINLPEEEEEMYSISEDEETKKIIVTRGDDAPDWADNSLYFEFDMDSTPIKIGGKNFISSEKHFRGIAALRIVGNNLYELKYGWKAEQSFINKEFSGKCVPPQIL